MPSRTPTLSISEKLKRKKLKQKQRKETKQRKAKQERKEKRKKKCALLDEIDLDANLPLIEDYSWDRIVIKKVREEDDVLNDFDKLSLKTNDIGEFEFEPEPEVEPEFEFETFFTFISKPTEAMEAHDLLYDFDLFQLEPLATKYKKGDKLFIVEDFTKGKYKPGGICIVRKAKENETYDVKMIIAGNIRRNVTVDLLTLPVTEHSKRNSIPTNFLGNLVSTQNKEYWKLYLREEKTRGRKQKSKFVQQQKLLAQWGNTWLSVTIVDVLADNSYNVHWTNFNEITWVREDELKPRG
tara:strand:+ start:519 stop:1406 length:888 start_codon:yes stop_codon:yes gene_type:complete